MGIVNVIADNKKASIGVKVAEYQNKGGAGSGNYGHAGIPGQIGGSRTGGGRGSKPTGVGKDRVSSIDRVAYKKLSAIGREKVLAQNIAKYKEQYTPVAKQAKSTMGLTRGKLAKWSEMNKTVGKYEGMRRAFVNKGDKAKGKERRKYYHMAVQLQGRAAALKSEMKKL